jgi:hypothetical protein
MPATATFHAPSAEIVRSFVPIQHHHREWSLSDFWTPVSKEATARAVLLSAMALAPKLSEMKQICTSFSAFLSIAVIKSINALRTPVRGATQCQEWKVLSADMQVYATKSSPFFTLSRQTLVGGTVLHGAAFPEHEFHSISLFDMIPRAPHPSRQEPEGQTPCFCTHDST